MRRFAYVIVFLICCGICYGVGRAAGVKSGTITLAAIGLGGGSALFLAVVVAYARRRSSWSAGIRVESWRKQAVALRQRDPDTYWQILAQSRAADDEEVADAARRDPDAYVALFLAAADEVDLDFDEPDRG